MRDTLGTAVWALLANKMRSLLTVLGITIGIAAVICVVPIGRAGQARGDTGLRVGEAQGLCWSDVRL